MDRVRDDMWQLITMEIPEVASKPLSKGPFIWEPPSEQVWAFKHSAGHQAHYQKANTQFQRIQPQGLNSRRKADTKCVFFKADIKMHKINLFQINV